MKDFAEVCDRVAATAKRLEKISLIAGYLRTCATSDLDAAARFFQGLVLGPREPELAIGGRTVSDAAQVVFHLKSTELRAAYRRRGDIGEALAELFVPALDLGLFRETLTPASVRDRLRQAAELRGDQAARNRRVIVEQLFAACTDAREVAAVAKILTGALRIGLREGLILDAVAQAFEEPVESVRRAAAAHADFGVIAVAAKEHRLDEIQPAYGLPVSAMLATPVVFGSEYRELSSGSWIAEDKFDGIRAQLHVEGAKVSLFSRRGNDIGESFPELCTAAAELFRTPVIFDGEILAARNGRPLPFRELQPRLQRKNPNQALQDDIPVAFVAFDLLAQGTEMLLDLPWSKRRERLEILLPAPAPKFVLAATAELTEPYAADIETRFLAARERGHEGLMLKRIDTPYTPGRRGMSWLKLKRELDTLDAVVVGVEWGHGKRAKMLSDYTFAVRGPDGELLTLGKAYSGLTDAEIIERTAWFQERMTGSMLTRRAYAVTPELVIEIAFDVIAPSTLHSSGYALRFPRIVRIRDDKPLGEISDLAQVEATYRTMLDREAKPHDEPS